jgi:hypothetical protein
LRNWSYSAFFEWLAGGSNPAMAASGSFVLSGSAQLRTFSTFAATGAFVMSATAALETSITMTAAGTMELTGEAALRAGKSAGRLAGCGHVLAADCDQWVIAPFL